MFWGLIMEPNKKYTQTVEKSFHLSMASLDASASSCNIVQVMICYDNRTYLLCSLQKGQVWQVPLDLNFQEGTKIAFTCNGGGHVHLTGYLLPDELDELELDDEEDDEEIPELPTHKRKASGSTTEKPAKKGKRVNLQNDEGDDDEDNSDFEDGVETDEENDSDDGLDDREEDLCDDDDDEEDDDDDDEDDNDDDDEENVISPPKKNKAHQNQHQNKKQDKQKPIINGKDSKMEQGKQKKNKDDSSKTEKLERQKKKVTSGGVQIEDLIEGNGSPAKSGKFVSVYYVGRLKNGKKFDSSTQGEGFKFRLGKGEVIRGWDIGIAGMKVGGKRRITIPPAMAYGAKGSPPVIPGNSTLTFEVELREVH